MGTISNKVIEKLDEKLAVSNGDAPNFIKVIKDLQKDLKTIKTQVSILSAK